MLSKIRIDGGNSVCAGYQKEGEMTEKECKGQKTGVRQRHLSISQAQSMKLELRLCGQAKDSPTSFCYNFVSVLETLHV